MLLKGVLAVLGSLSVILLLILCVTLFSEEETWCNKELNAGECELYDQDDTCYCINTITSIQSQIDYYVASEASCDKLKGQLATPRDNQLLKWLAKRLYLKGVDNAIVGMRKVDSIWYWMEPEGPLEATDLIWREDVEQNQQLSHAAIDVHSITVYNNEYYNGYKSYNYDFYVDYDTNYNWYGFVAINVTIGAERYNKEEHYFICQYVTRTQPTSKLENYEEYIEILTEKPSVTTTKPPLVTAAKDVSVFCECSQYEQIELSELDDSKIISSPGYPQGYCMNQKCGWSIKAEENLAIRLEWMAFNTEDQMDFVHVYDAQSKDNSKLLATCTGTTCTNHMSSGQSMYIHFTSDHVTQDIGFRAVVTAIDTDACYCSKLQEITLGSTDESFSFTSPNFLQDNCKNQNCKWIISCPDGYGLHIIWKQISIDLSSVVLLRDGELEEKSCSDDHCDDLITENTQLTVQYITSDDENGTSVGFSALVKVVQNYCDKADLNSPQSIVYTKEMENGLISIGGTATITCPPNHNINDYRMSDWVTCISPHWERQLSKCVAVCHLNFVRVTPKSAIISMCDFGFIQKTKQVPVGHEILVDVYNMTDTEDHSSVRYSCTNAGWSPPKSPICAIMTPAILLIHGLDAYRKHITKLSIYIPNKNVSSQLKLEVSGGRTEHISELMMDGLTEREVLITGGKQDNDYLSSSYMVDVNRGKISMAPGPIASRWGSASSAYNNLVYVCAGYGSLSENLDSRTSCEEFDGHSWSLLPAPTGIAMSGEHLKGEMVAPFNGYLYLMGGIDTSAPFATNGVEKLMCSC